MAGKNFPIKVILSAIDRLSGPVMHAASNLRKLGIAGSGLRNRFVGRLGVPVFTAALRDSRQHLDAFNERMSSLWSLVRNVTAALAVTAGTVLYAANSYAEYTGKINDQVKATGLSAEALQGWSYVAKQSGIEQDKFLAAMRLGSRTMGLAALGQGKARDVLRGFGIQLKDTTGKFRSMDSLLPEIADKIKALKTPQLQAAAAAQLFGRSGADMLPFLLEGSAGIKAMTDRAKALGLVLSNDAIAQGDELGDTMDDVRASLLGVRNTIFVQLAPALIQLARQFSDFVVRNRPQIEAFAQMLATKLPGALDHIGASFAALFALLQPFMSVLGFLNDLFGASNLIMLALSVTIAVKVTAAIMALIAVVEALGIALTTTPVGWIIAGLTALALAALAIYNNWDKLVDWWGRVWETIGGTVYHAVQRILGFLPDWLVRMMGGGTTRVYTQNSAPPAGTPTAATLGPPAGTPTAATLGPQAAGGGRQDYVRVQVDMNNLPAGTRVNTDTTGLPFELNQGFALAAP